MKLTKSQLKQIIKEELSAMIEKKKKTNCFDHTSHKTFKSKSACIQKQKGWGKERANAYVASVERKRGHIDEEEK